VRQVIVVGGSHTIVQGLTVQNGLGYTLEVRGADNAIVRCNTLTMTVPFDGRSDQMKLDGGASRIQILGNSFSRWRSQAIDMTGVEGVLVIGNEFTDPEDADGGAVGMKLGTRSVTIQGNWIHDLGDAIEGHVFSMGGTGAPYEGDHLAYDLHVVGNRVERLAGIFAQLVSCQGCSIEGNLVGGLGAGFLLSAAALGDPQCEGSPDGCKPSDGTRIAGNVVRDLDGGGDPEQANVFVAVDPGEGEGFTAGDNRWCAPSPEETQFVWQAETLGFEGWVEATGTDETSTPLADDDPACSLD
jgi:hypothetical protein